MLQSSIRWWFGAVVGTRRAVKLWLALVVVLWTSCAFAAPFVYVATGNAIAVVDVVTNTLVATVPVGTNPQGVAVNYNGSFVYVANQGSNTVSVIATATNTVTATIAVGTAPIGIAVNLAGTFVYVQNSVSKSTSVISTATNTVVATVAQPFAQPPGPFAVAIDPASTFVFMGTDSGHINVINPATNTIVGDYASTVGALGMTVAPGGGSVYVIDSFTPNFQIFSATTLATLGTVALAGSPMLWLRVPRVPSCMSPIFPAIR